MIAKVCKCCGREFKADKKVVECCSHDCAAKLHGVIRREYTKKCHYCKKEFHPYTTIDKFCSAQCRIDNMKSKRTKHWAPEKAKRRIGENNPAYRNGMYQRSSTRYFKGMREFERNGREIEQKMIDEEGYKYCEHCGTSNPIRFERHHIVFRSERPNHPNLHCKKNIIILCIQCHNEFHKYKGLRNDLVRERALNILFDDNILDKEIGHRKVYIK